MTTNQPKRLERNDLTLRDLADKLDRLTEELAQAQKWQDRTWVVVKWVGGISTGLSISTAIALVSIVLRYATEKWQPTLTPGLTVSWAV